MNKVSLLLSGQQKSIDSPLDIWNFRSSRPEVFCKNSVLRNFQKFTEDLCKSPFFNKVADLRSTTLLKKKLWHRCFSVNFVKFPRTLFYIELLGCCFWNLLKVQFSRNTYQVPESFQIRLFQNKKRGLKTWNSLRVEVTACGIYRIELNKECKF